MYPVGEVANTLNLPTRGRETMGCTDVEDAVQAKEAKTKGPLADLSGKLLNPLSTGLDTLLGGDGSREGTRYWHSLWVVIQAYLGIKISVPKPIIDLGDSMHTRTTHSEAGTHPKVHTRDRVHPKGDRTFEREQH